MGAAFAEGMARSLALLGFDIAELIHINPFQANDIITFDSDPSGSHTLTTDYQNTDDWVISKIPFSGSGDIQNADYRIREESGMNIFELLYRHYSPIGIQGRFFWDNLNRKQIDTYETE